MDQDRTAAKQGFGGLLLALALLSVFASGAGFLAGGALRKQIESGARTEPNASPPAKLSGQKVTPLPQIVTNLAGASGTWVRLEASALSAPGRVVEPEQINRVAQDLVGLLRTLTVSQVSGPHGFLHLRDEINERARTRTQGAVSEITIQSMVIE